MTVRVSVVTPVYNGAAFLGECIESVLGQTYGDFSYTILNNCSTDGTQEIAAEYARRDSRVRVETSQTFVSAIENHNRAVSLVPSDHQYCKIVSADDWIMPECLGRMIALADAHPNVGIVGCYQRSGSGVRWQGVSPAVTVMSGRDAARLGLLNGIHVLGTPTSVLYRADQLRKRPAFFPHNRSHADTSACYEIFQDADFGFIHDVLSVERVHARQWTTEMDALDAGSVAYLEVLIKYGPVFLTVDELRARLTEVFDRYYRALGGCLLKLKGREYWAFHRSRLNEIGCRLEWTRVARGAAAEMIAEAKSPATAMRKVLAVMRDS
jgi:glycosyltransferase involved in cell wall biosynthesis